jgi:hypothetical protein
LIARSVALEQSAPFRKRFTPRCMSRKSRCVTQKWFMTAMKRRVLSSRSCRHLSPTAYGFLLLYAPFASKSGRPHATKKSSCGRGQRQRGEEEEEEEEEGAPSARRAAACST